jgi:hypothetical protein
MGRAVVRMSTVYDIKKSGIEKATGMDTAKKVRSELNTEQKSKSVK